MTSWECAAYRCGLLTRVTRFSLPTAEMAHDSERCTGHLATQVICTTCLTALAAYHMGGGIDCVVHDADLGMQLPSMQLPHQAVMAH